MIRIVSFLIVAVFFVSCSQRFTLEKRHYRKGFHWAAQKHAKQQTTVYSITQAKTTVTEVNNEVVKQPTAMLATDQVAQENNITKPFLNQNGRSFTRTKTLVQSNNFSHKPALIGTNKQNIKKQLHLKSKRDGNDFINTVLIGYLVIALIIAFLSSVAINGLAQTLLFAAFFVLALVILYAIGKLFRSLFGLN